MAEKEGSMLAVNVGDIKIWSEIRILGDKFGGTEIRIVDDKFGGTEILYLIVATEILVTNSIKITSKICHQYPDSV